MGKKSGYKYTDVAGSSLQQRNGPGLQWLSLGSEIWGDSCHHYTFRSLFPKLPKINLHYFDNCEQITLRTNNFARSFRWCVGSCGHFQGLVISNNGNLNTRFSFLGLKKSRLSLSSVSPGNFHNWLVFSTDSALGGRVFIWGLLLRRQEESRNPRASGLVYFAWFILIVWVRHSAWGGTKLNHSDIN